MREVARGEWREGVPTLFKRLFLLLLRLLVCAKRKAKHTNLRD